MDRFSVVAVRTSLVYLLAGFLVGAYLLTLDGLGLPPPLPALGIVHAHLLFVGWLVQFGIGIAYWLLPRRRRPEQPIAYSERLAFFGYALLNLGLLSRVIGQPMLPAARTEAGTLLVFSAALQLVAATIFVGQLWRRVAGRPAPPS